MTKSAIEMRIKNSYCFFIDPDNPDLTLRTSDAAVRPALRNPHKYHLNYHKLIMGCIAFSPSVIKRLESFITEQHNLLHICILADGLIVETEAGYNARMQYFDEYQYGDISAEKPTMVPTSIKQLDDKHLTVIHQLLDCLINTIVTPQRLILLKVNMPNIHLIINYNLDASKGYAYLDSAFPNGKSWHSIKEKLSAIAFHNTRVVRVHQELRKNATMLSQAFRGAEQEAETYELGHLPTETMIQILAETCDIAFSSSNHKNVRSMVFHYFDAVGSEKACCPPIQEDDENSASTVASSSSSAMSRTPFR